MPDLSRRSFLIGATALASSKLLTRRVAPLIPSKIYSYGHSFTMGPTPPTGPYPYAPNPYAGIVGANYSVPVDYNGRSGTRLLDSIRGIVAPQFAGLNPNPRLWSVGGTNGSTAVLLQNVHNDESSALGNDPAYQEGYRGALRLAMGVFGARSYIPASNADYASAGWVAKSYPSQAPGGVLHYTKTYGDKMDFTVSGSTATIATIGVDSDFLSNGTMKIYVNDVLWDGTRVVGSDAGYWHGTGKTKAYADGYDGANRTWSLYGLRVTGMPSGYNKLTVRKVDDTINPIWIAGIYQPTGTPPKVFVAQEPLRNPEATSQGGYEQFVENDPAYRSIIEEVVGSFSFGRVVDLAPGWDNPTMVATAADPGFVADPFNFHPNHVGMQFIASKFIESIDAE